MNKKNKIEILFFSAFILGIYFYLFTVNSSVQVYAMTNSSSNGSLTHTTSSTSSSGGLVLLSSDFNGIWKETIPKVNNSLSSSSGSIGLNSSGRFSELQIPTTNNSSSSGGTTQDNSLITFKLCLENGKLIGSVQNITPGIKEEIISQNVISESKAELTLQNKDKITNKMKITLLNSRELKCKIEGGRTFNAKKINSFKQCSSPK